MLRTESPEDRARRVGVPLGIALLILAPVIHSVNELLGVNDAVSNFPGEATLLMWSLIAVLVAAVFTRGFGRVLSGTLAVLCVPQVLSRLYHGANVTFGLTTPTEAVVITCAGICVVMIMSLTTRGLPLVTKELLELSARRRTYILRTVYAVLAFLTAFSFSFETLSNAWQSPYAILGKGQELFSFFVGLQFFGIYLFLPALCCNVITSEKERDTLSLLFLTRLSPWGILAGKFLSRFVSMLLFLALSLPLFGYAYSMGGFQTKDIWAAIWVLLVTSLQVGTLALFCSCWFRRTSGAFIAAYLLTFAVMFGPILLDEITGIVSEIYRDLSSLVANRQLLGFERWSIQTMFFAPAVLWQNGPMTPSGEFLQTVLRTIPMLFLTGCSLLASRMVVVRRANVPPRNLLLKLFRFLDSIFFALNEQFGRGIVLTGGRNRLPRTRPIAWRETSRRTLGTTRYLIRIFIGMEFPTLLICCLCVSAGNDGRDLLRILLIAVWIIVVLLVCGASTSLISSERSSQTFDTLLTTPMTNRQILRQKFVGVRRLLFVVSIPLLTIYGFESALRYDVPGLFSRRGMSAAEMAFCYGATGLLTVLIYLPMVSWLSFWIGMKVSSQSKAIMASVGVLVGWCAIPLLILMPFHVAYDLITPAREWPLLISPATMIPNAPARCTSASTPAYYSVRMSPVWAQTLPIFRLLHVGLL